MSKLTVGTYNGLAYSILIHKKSARPGSNQAFVADVNVASPEGEIIESFIEQGSEDWQVRNACIKRIMTEVSHEHYNS